MKIEKRGIVITEVPGVEWIKVDSAEVQVKLTVHEYVLHYTPETLGQFVEALTAARNAAEELVERLGGLPEPRVFWVGESIPDDVITVVDCNDLRWRRTGAGCWALPNGRVESDPWLLRKYGPLTEVPA
jgi:hypothetical protein